MWHFMALSRVLALVILQFLLIALVSSSEPGTKTDWKTLQGVFLNLLPFNLLMFPMIFAYLLATIEMITSI